MEGRVDVEKETDFAKPAATSRPWPAAAHGGSVVVQRGLARVGSRVGGPETSCSCRAFTSYSSPRARRRSTWVTSYSYQPCPCHLLYTMTYCVPILMPHGTRYLSTRPPAPCTPPIASHLMLPRTDAPLQHTVRQPAPAPAPAARSASPPPRCDAQSSPPPPAAAGRPWRRQRQAADHVMTPAAVAAAAMQGSLSVTHENRGTGAIRSRNPCRCRCHAAQRRRCWGDAAGAVRKRRGRVLAGGSGSGIWSGTGSGCERAVWGRWVPVASRSGGSVWRAGRRRHVAGRRCRRCRGAGGRRARPGDGWRGGRGSG